MSGQEAAYDQHDGSAPYLVDLDFGPTADGDDLHFGPVTFYRHKSPDGLLPVILDPGDGGPKAIRLAVAAGVYAGPLDDPGDVVNDRCELRGPKQRLGVDAWNGFSIRVPPDFPILPLRCVVAQVKMPYDASGDGSPALALRIDDGRWLATVEHLYEPDDKKAGRFLSGTTDGVCLAGAPAFDHSNFNKYDGLTDFQVRAVLASQDEVLASDLRAREFDVCTTGVRVQTQGTLPALRPGVWTDFVMRIRSSGLKDVDGLVELYADGTLVARATGEFGYPNTESEPVQYFKVGPYRNNDPRWGTAAASLDYRNIRRGASAPEMGIIAASDLIAENGQVDGMPGFAESASSQPRDSRA